MIDSCGKRTRLCSNDNAHGCHLSFTGDSDSCVAASTHAAGGPFKFCLADLQTPAPLDTVTWGVCMPRSCGLDDARALLAASAHAAQRADMRQFALQSLTCGQHEFPAMDEIAPSSLAVFAVG